MPDADPFAGAYDASAPGTSPTGRMQVRVPMGAVPPDDPFVGAEDRGPGTGAQDDQVSAVGAAREGFLDTATFGARARIKAASRASGLPEWLGGLRSPVGGIEMLLEQAGGKPGPVTETYETELKQAEKEREAAKSQQPVAYTGGQIAGGLVGPSFGAGTGATLGARAARSALAGAAQGGAYGLNTAQGGTAEQLKGAATGAAIGGVAGGVLSPVTDIAAAGAGKAAEVGKSVYNTIRAEFNPSFVEDQAASKVVAAHLAGNVERGGKPALSPEELQAAQAAGVPRAAVDIGGERSLALARGAADESPEARAALGELAQERYAGQSRRVGGFIKSMVGGADVGATRESLQAQARAANAPAYRRAYAQGSGNLTVSDDLAQAPAVQAAMRDAATSGKNRAAAEGMSFDPAKRNMQFWDYTYRNVRDAASAAGRAGNNDAASSLGGIATRLRDELDSQVPTFKQAREGAASYFGAQDALEAGQKFVGSKIDNRQAAREIGSMSPADRQLFAQGFASHLADQILNLRDSENVITKAFLTSPAAKERIQIALGKDNADRLEALLRVEAQVDRLRQAMGNSKTNQFQLARALTKGVAGAGGTFEAYEAAKETFGEDGFDPEKISLGHLLGSAVAFGGLYGKARTEAFNEELARRVGQLLVSDDPAVLRRGIEIVTKSKPLMDAIRNLGQHTATAASTAARRLISRVPATQGPNATP